MYGKMMPFPSISVLLLHIPFTAHTLYIQSGLTNLDCIFYSFQAGLTKEKERELNDAIQSHFREWLQGSNLLRQIYDLSNLEKADDGTAVAASAALVP